MKTRRFGIRMALRQFAVAAGCLFIADLAVAANAPFSATILPRVRNGRGPAQPGDVIIYTVEMKNLTTNALERVRFYWDMDVVAVTGAGGEPRKAGKVTLERFDPSTVDFGTPQPTFADGRYKIVLRRMKANETVCGGWAATLRESTDLVNWTPVPPGRVIQSAAAMGRVSLEAEQMGALGFIQFTVEPSGLSPVLAEALAEQLGSGGGQ